MNTRWHSCFEKMNEALDTMLSFDVPAKSNIAHAYREILVLVRNDFPDSCLDAYDYYVSLINKYKRNDVRGGINFDSVRNSSLAEISAAFVELYRCVAIAYYTDKGAAA